jgi:hypothetical protein
MCRQRAAVARKEMEYWLNEAEEWTRVSTSTLRPGEPGAEKIACASIYRQTT